MFDRGRPGERRPVTRGERDDHGRRVKGENRIRQAPARHGGLTVNARSSGVLETIDSSVLTVTQPR